ncbi:MAG: hypothetical protein ACP5NP_10265 [Acetobacteraceae bacterium]
MAVLAAGVFDDVLTSPRLGAVIYWVLLMGVGMAEGGRGAVALSKQPESRRPAE